MPYMSKEWRDAAHQRVMDYVNEMIADGRAWNIQTTRKLIEEEPSGYNEEKLQEGERGSWEWGW